MKKNIGLLFLIVLCIVQNTSAQSITGNIEGRILDSLYHPIADVNISVNSVNLQGSRGTSTDQSGYFRIYSLPVGEYTINLSHVAYQALIINNLNVYLGQTTTLGNLRLKERSIEMEEVKVSAGNLIIDSRSTAYGKTISAPLFNSLPIERNYLNIAELLPHANLSYKNDGGTNFGGATGVENKYFIDGADVTEPSRGSRQIELPYNFIREIEIMTGGYQAEYQSALGGIVNAVTYTGSNEFHGTVFSFFTNNNFSRPARPASGEPPHGNYYNYDFGFGIDGPVNKDKLWFYAAYDPNFASEDVAVTGLGYQNSYSTEHKFAGKLTWRLNESNHLSLSVFGNPAKGRDIYAPGNGLSVSGPERCNYNFASRQLSAALTGIHSIYNGFVVQSSFSFIDSKFINEPPDDAGKEPFFDDFVENTSTGGRGIIRNNRIRQMTLNIKGTLTFTYHIIKGGIEYQHNSIKLHNP